jgi:peptidoglycan/LPS O-acetylase OafA/YrhL
MTTTTTTTTNRIPSLDGLRGIAIIMVLLGHGAYSFPTITAPLFQFIGNGSLGVKIFFVQIELIGYQ